jgi:MFS family permease
MAMVGVVFALTTNFLWLVVAATIGVLSPSDKEVGPFLSIEQAALSQTVADDQRTAVFAWYNLVGSVTAAFGALVGGLACQHFLRVGATGADVYRPLVVAYGIVGACLAVGFTRLSQAAESRKTGEGIQPKRWLGLHRSRPVVLRLSALFALDAFGGGFILQSIVAYWFYVRFQLDPAALGSLFFVANLLAAASALGAAALADRFGLINTMVFTHLPSNILLILVPLMPTVELAVAVLLIRFCISQMDVPTRQSYTMAVVHPDERSAASGITTVARSIGAALSPTLAGYLLADSRLLSFPFFIAGGVKIVYDLWLYRAFVAHDPDAAR